MAALVPVPHAVVDAVQKGNMEVFLEYLQNQPLSAPLPVIDLEGCSLLHWAAINNREAIIQLLLERGADLNYIGGILQENPLQWAVRNEKQTPLVLDMLRRGADFAHKSTVGMDSLQIAVRMGHVNMAYLLLAHNAAPDVPDHKGDTALLYLMKNPDVENGIDLVRLLLRYGADLFKEDAEGYNSLHVLCNSRKIKNRRLLTLICKYGGKTLSTTASSINEHTPSMIAYTYHNYQMIQYLLDTWLFYRCPPRLVILANATGVFLLFLGTHLFGWWGCLAALFVIPMVFSRIDMMSIEIGSSHPIHGKVYGLVSGLAWVFTLYLAHHVNALLRYSIYSGVAIIFLTLYMTSATKPCGIVVEDRHDLIEAVARQPPEGTIESVRICPTCLINKSRVSIHCGVCDMCVEALDHHCPFVDNCVGPKNRRVFVAFALSASLTCLVIFFLCLYIYPLPTCPPDAFTTLQKCYFFQHPVYFGSTWLYAFVAFWTGAIGLNQLVFVASETTTFEAIRTDVDLVVVARRIVGNVGKTYRNLLGFLWTGRYTVTKHVSTRKPHVHGPGCAHGHSHDHAHGNGGMQGVGVEHPLLEFEELVPHDHHTHGHGGYFRAGGDLETGSGYGGK